jgi:predicted nucleotidyltransferase
MERDDVASKLREHEPELRHAGILSLSLFGSVAHGEASSQSDVDLMADFDASKELSLLGAVGLENRLQDILGVKVDLSQRKALKTEVLSQAIREAVAVTAGIGLR